MEQGGACTHLQRRLGPSRAAGMTATGGRAPKVVDKPAERCCLMAIPGGRATRGAGGAAWGCQLDADSS